MSRHHRAGCCLPNRAEPSQRTAGGAPLHRQLRPQQQRDNRRQADQFFCRNCRPLGHPCPPCGSQYSPYWCRNWAAAVGDCPLALTGSRRTERAGHQGSPTHQILRSETWPTRGQTVGQPPYGQRRYSCPCHQEDLPVPGHTGQRLRSWRPAGPCADVCHRFHPWWQQQCERRRPGRR